MSATTAERRFEGTAHWTRKGDADLFLWRKIAPEGAPRGVALFVHGSSMASQPTFDLHVPGWPWSSAMDWFAARGFDCWCVDMEGYGRSTKNRGLRATISEGADELEAAADHIAGVTWRCVHGGLRDLAGGAVRGSLRRAQALAGVAARARRLCLDGRGQPDAR